jgi:integrase
LLRTNIILFQSFREASCHQRDVSKSHLLYHGIRHEELCLLRLKDMQSRQCVMHFRIKGKSERIRFGLIHPLVSRLIEEYLEMGKLGGGIMFELEGPSSGL